MLRKACSKRGHFTHSLFVWTRSAQMEHLSIHRFAPALNVHNCDNFVALRSRLPSYACSRPKLQSLQYICQHILTCDKKAYSLFAKTFSMFFSTSSSSNSLSSFCLSSSEISISHPHILFSRFPYHPQSTPRHQRTN